MRVLIADDHRLTLEGFRRILERVEDIEVVGATHDGTAVAGLVERRRPEVLALELGLRDADGRACLDVVREAHPGVTIVVLSASTAEADIRSALSRGARAYVVKTVDPVDIPSALRLACEQTLYHVVGDVPGPEQILRAAGLTDREVEMLKALTRGLSNKAIGQELWVTEQTVKFHLGNLYRKLGVTNRTAAVSYAHVHGVAA